MANGEDSLTSPESREAEIRSLIQRLSTLTIIYWLPGLDETGKTDTENEIEEVLTRLKERGVDPEAAIRLHDSQSK